MPNPDDRSCFYCEHLILDGLNSWCDIRRCGTVCEDYVPHLERIANVAEHERKYSGLLEED